MKKFAAALLLSVLTLPVRTSAQTAPPAPTSGSTGETAPAAPTPTEAPPPAPQTTPPPAGSRRRNRFRVGPEVGLYLPTAGKTRDRFGDTWTSLGIGIGAIDTPSQRGGFSVTLNFVSQARGDHHAFLAPLGVSYRRSFGDSPSARPYVGVTPALDFTDIRSPEDDVHSRIRLTGGVSIFTGLTFNENGNVEVRYQEVARVKGFDLSGLLLSAGYRF